ncbi:MAG: hypothetical protein K5774_07760 [Clostridia bacterium]|nr:hypothetical protein [Clostridia bacterium]
MMYNKDELYRRNRRGFIAFTLFMAAFAGVYEIFSHGVYSAFMIFAFMVPLVLAVIPYTVLIALGIRGSAGIPVSLYQSGVVTLTIGSAFLGVLEIYGTTSRLAIIYPVLGGLLIAAAIITAVLARFGKIPG